MPLAVREKRDPAEALRRLRLAKIKFPNSELIYTETLKVLRQENKIPEFEALISQAVDKFPNSVNMASEYAKLAFDKHQWSDAIVRYQRLLETVPDDPAVYIGLANAFEAGGEPSKAESILKKLADFCPSDVRGFMALASLAERQGDAAVALERWRDAERRFPLEQSVAKAAFEARLSAAGSDLGVDSKTTTTDVPGSGSDAQTSTDRMRKLILNFESLGGTKLGCEFGLFQREYGAEPLGLLRWTDITPEALARALSDKFEGVGDPENDGACGAAN